MSGGDRLLFFVLSRVTQRVVLLLLQVHGLGKELGVVDIFEQFLLRCGINFGTLQLPSISFINWSVLAVFITCFQPLHCIIVKVIVNKYMLFACQLGGLYSEKL